MHSIESLADDFRTLKIRHGDTAMPPRFHYLVILSYTLSVGICVRTSPPILMPAPGSLADRSDYKF